ncbi:protein odr-4 homolog isoform X1 [Podarcis muralis]|uniref:protein odr-4 homolog isoform X1 n=2 Tax=Podarcis muralis TaxID=64176 RepID=UPI00109FA914|nr:protein odr-4 homolog isoform X1 [Podarcis muralis]XP_028588338.1 protein odr-4 homolog isoform X1 [Podarcis muralis]
MGRSYFVEEAVGQYLSELATNSQALLTGLLVGQCSQQRDYVVLAVRTPPKEEESKSNTSRRSDLSNIDEEWIAAHANQVSRMLPGGLLVLGVFTVAAPELAKEIQNTLRKLVFSVEKSVARKRLWNISEEDVSDRVALHLCSATKKMLCRTYDVQDPKSTAKPADWKYQHGLATSWLSLECTINANIHIPLPVTLASHDLEKNTRNGLARWAKQIEEAVFLINGQVREEDADLLEGQKKSARGNTPSATQSLDVRVLMQLSRSSNARSTATVQICSGSINLKGALKCKAYIHNNKPRVKDAVKALKRDIINTLSDRCEMLFEDLLLNETPGKKNSEREYHTLPCRVFAPIVGSSVLLCDYKFGDETAREIQERFLEMLDQAVQPEDLQTAEEMNMVEVTPLKEFQDVVQEKRLTKEVLLLKLHQNIGVVIAVVVAISAAAFSFNYFSD